jgi:hypothetical protein
MNIARLLLTILLGSVFIPMQLAWGQSTPLVANSTAISCATSGNGTGHLVCAESGRTGVSWWAPPHGNGSLVQVSLSEPAATRTVGVNCAPSGDLGTTVCLLAQFTTLPCTGHPTCTIPTSINWNASLTGIGFYPPNNEPAPQPSVPPFQTASDSMVIMGVSDPGVGSPGCANIATFEVICAVNVNFKLQRVLINSNTRTVSGMVPLPFSITGTPSCTFGGNSAAICAESEGGLNGFAFDNNGLAVLIHLGGTGFSQPSCATPGDGKNVAICAAISGNMLLGIAFDPRTGYKTAFQNLGTAPDTGQWLGPVGCAFPNDSMATNEVACVAISSSGNVYAVKFDPRNAGTSPPIRGPFFSGAGSSLSCVTLAVDQNQITCGVIRSGGGSSGFNVPLPSGP